MSELFTRLYVRATECAKGQTMGEYALIMAAVAVIAFAGYQLLGQDISDVLVKINADL